MSGQRVTNEQARECLVACPIDTILMHDLAADLLDARAEIERLKIELTVANIYKAEYLAADEAMGDGPSTKNTLVGNIRALLARSSRDGAGVTEAYRVIINGQYDAATCCVVTTHGEPLVVFDTDEGSLAPLDGKAVTVTVRGE